jgi:hypothetical protein
MHNDFDMLYEWLDQDIAMEADFLHDENMRKHMFADHFTRGGNPKMNERMMKDLGMSDEYNHVKHARDLQQKAGAKRQSEMFNKFFGR